MDLDLSRQSVQQSSSKRRRISPGTPLASAKRLKHIDLDPERDEHALLVPSLTSGGSPAISDVHELRRQVEKKKLESEAGVREEIQFLSTLRARISQARVTKDAAEIELRLLEDQLVTEESNRMQVIATSENELAQLQRDVDTVADLMCTVSARLGKAIPSATGQQSTPSETSLANVSLPSPNMMSQGPRRDEPEFDDAVKAKLQYIVSRNWNLLERNIFLNKGPQPPAEEHFTLHRPMDWRMVKEKLNLGQYNSLQQFMSDGRDVFWNIRWNNRRPFRQTLIDDLEQQLREDLERYGFRGLWKQSDPRSE